MSKKINKSQSKLQSKSKFESTTNATDIIDLLSVSPSAGANNPVTWKDQITDYGILVLKYLFLVVILTLNFLGLSVSLNCNADEEMFKRILSAIFDVNTNEISSDGLLNFNAEYFIDPDTEIFYIYLIITGVYKKCNYASEELDVFTPTASSSAVVVNTLKKKSKSPEEFHKLLDEKPNLKKKYLQLKAKLGK